MIIFYSGCSHKPHRYILREKLDFMMSYHFAKGEKGRRFLSKFASKRRGRKP